MPLTKLKFTPGQDTQLSQTADEGGWFATQLIRFRDGLPQKIAGWVSYATNTVMGYPRAMHTWQQLNSVLDLAVGTHQKLQLWQTGSFYDITPARRVASLTNPFATTTGSKTVTVADTAHGAVIGDFVEISGASVVGGITISGEYTVVTIAASAYTITSAMPAMSSATGGGTVGAVYLISPGPANTIVGTGVGVGTVGTGTVGTARTASAAYLCRTWALANWGEYLLASPVLGPLYQWLPAGGFNTRAIVVTNATPSIGPPLQIGSMFIAMPERHCILLGCSDLNASTNYDPMIVRFSDVEDYTSYMATATNSAGSFRLQGGTRLICGINGSQTNLLFSDTSVFSMRFIGFPYVYSFDRLGTGCGIIGPHAMVEFNGVTYWMGHTGFYAFTGSAPQLIECPIWNTIFENINDAQGDKVYCGVNSAQNEILWFYPSMSSFENDRYVAYNYVERTWHSGTLPRAAWVDRSTFSKPLAIDVNGNLFQQETGVDAAGIAIPSSIESGFMDIGDGTQVMYIDRIIPDFGSNQVGNVLMTVKTSASPNSNPVTHGPYILTPTTQFVTIRARGRQISFKFASSSIGDYWRLGVVRVQAIGDGRR